MRTSPPFKPEASIEPDAATEPPRMVAWPPSPESEETSMIPELAEDPSIRPERSKVILPPLASPISKVASPARRAADPPETVRAPAFSKSPPIRAVNSSALIEPRFITLASEFPSKARFPERKSESARSKVEAIKA